MLTFTEAVEAIRYEDEMVQTGVGALVRIALRAEGLEECSCTAALYVEAAGHLGYREFGILADIFGSFGKTISAKEYDQLLKAIDLGHECEGPSSEEGQD